MRTIVAMMGVIERKNQTKLRRKLKPPWEEGTGQRHLEPSWGNDSPMVKVLTALK